MNCQRTKLCINALRRSVRWIVIILLLCLFFLFVVILFSHEFLAGQNWWWYGNTHGIYSFHVQIIHNFSFKQLLVGFHWLSWKMTFARHNGTADYGIWYCIKTWTGFQNPLNNCSKTEIELKNTTQKNVNIKPNNGTLKIPSTKS